MRNFARWKISGSACLLLLVPSSAFGDTPIHKGIKPLEGLSGLSGANSSTPNKLSAFLSGSPRRNFYLDCNYGKDSNNGRTAKYPVKTLAKAAQLITTAGDRLLIKKGSICRGTLSLIKPGFDGQIFVNAYADPKNPGAYLPVIAGADNISSLKWKYVAAPSVGGKAIAELKGKVVYKVAVPGSGDVRQLIIGGKVKSISSNIDRCNSSSSPNPLATGYAKVGGSTVINATIVPPEEIQLRYPLSAGSEIFLRENAWAWKKFPLLSVIPSQKQLKFDTKFFSLDVSTFAKYGYRILNSMAHMDCEGEWSFNPATRELHYVNEGSIPAPGTAGRPVEVTVRDYGINIDLGMKGSVAIQNIKVFHTANTAIKFRNTANVALKRVYVFRNNGYGLEAWNIGNLSVHSSFFANSSHANIKATKINNSLHLEGNRVSNSGALGNQRAQTSDLMPGMMVHALQKLKVKNNVISGSGYAGILISPESTTHIEVKNNNIVGSCLLGNDCGAIYITGYKQNAFLGADNIAGGLRGVGDKDRLSVNAECSATPPPRKAYIESNYINYSSGNLNGLPDGYKRLGGGIYLDWAASHAYIHNNVITNALHMRGAIHIHGGRNISIHANKINQSANGYPALSLAQLWNYEKQAVKTCFNSATNNQFKIGASSQTLVQLRINNYAKGETNPASLGKIEYNTFIRPASVPVARHYEFSNGESTVELFNPAGNVYLAP